MKYENRRIARLPFAAALAMLLALPLAPESAVAQNPGTPEFQTASSENTSLLFAVRKIMGLVQDVTKRHAADPVAKELDFFSANAAAGTGFRDSAGDFTTDDLVEVLYSLRSEVRAVSRELDARNDDLLLRRMTRIEETIDEALDLAKRQPSRAYTSASRPERVQARSYSGDADNRADRVRVTVSDRDDDVYRSDWDENFDDWKMRNRRWRTTYSSFAGDYTRSWPFAEQAMYRESPGVRYNRVEGLVLGVRRRPLDWNSYEQARIYGQGAYAFELKEWRYEIGAEAKVGNTHRRQEFGFKFGASYHRNTTTNDLWKSSWTENSLAGSLFGYDFFDYFETEGWTAYGVARITPYIQLSAGYRDDTYRTLDQNTSWALFGGDHFRPNPEIDDGKMNSVVVAVDGGRVRGYTYRPDGFSFRLAAEFGKGLGGDFSYNTYMGDVRTFIRITHNTGFDVRFRGGFSDGEVPVQKKFTLGGIGSVRSYPQNLFIGSRMMLANAEYTIYKQGLFDDVFDELSLFGLFDAGWSNYNGLDKFEWNEVISAAGFGVAIDERVIRLELAWPLKDIGTGMSPSLWLRLNPTF